MPDETFDVFLSHNSKDKPVVRQIQGMLEARGLKVWIDEKDLVPGRRWIPALEDAIQKTITFAVCIGENGIGPWVRPEIEGALLEHVDRQLPVIPVLLPDAPAKVDLPLFLRAFTWVDLRPGLTEAALNRLEQGIREKEKSTPVAAPSTRPHLHNLPYPALGNLLKGRDEELRSLQTGHATAITQTQAIYGLGGIGKTRLAVEYAWRSGDRYETALFVVADSPEALRSGLARLAGPDLLDLPEYEAGAEAKMIAAVQRWLRDHDRWLLILDNVDTPAAQEAVIEVLPSLSSGRVLITSRLRDWPPTVRSQPLETLSLDEAQKFLLERTAQQRTPGDHDEGEARHLAEELGRLPLALEQAAAYIAHHQMTFADYLKSWEKERTEVLTWHNKNVMQYPASVAATWQTTLRRLSPTATAILRLTTYLAPDPIPIEMVETEEKHVMEAVELLGGDSGVKPEPQSAKIGLAELASYSMVIRKGTTFAVHRIVQEVLRSRIPEEQRRAWIELSLKVVNRFSPSRPDDVRTWLIWDVLRPHASLVVQYADKNGIAFPTARLMSQLALFLKAKALFREAEPLIRRALEIDETSQNPHQSDVAACLNNLAQLLLDTNRAVEAEPLMRRALQIDESSFGPRHPRVSTQLVTLAKLLRDTNRLTEAEPLMRRALQIDQDYLGFKHPNIATDLSNLAQLLKAKNRLTEAEPLMRRALQIDEDSFGPQHPKVAIRLNNLALLLQDTNRLAEAEPLMRRSLDIFERSLGPNHPSTEIVRKNLAHLLQKIALQAKLPSSPEGAQE